MVFGNPLSFSVYPLNPFSTFEVNFTFLDDGGGRVMSLMAGRQTLTPHLALPSKVIYNVGYALGPASLALLPEGGIGIAFSFKDVAGPNAILSSFTLASCNASDPPVSPPVLPMPTHDLPRLTPAPLAVDGAEAVRLDLMGSWQFNPAPSAMLLAALRGGQRAAAAAELAAAEWSPIIVPGEYTLQGFRVSAGQPVVYQTSFTPPASWSGLQMKLKCDGIFSNATIYLNGVVIGAHLGGFTPFEVDATKAVAGSGPQNLTIVVVSTSLADTLASASTYAAHDLGGITRKIYLIAVPTLSIADVHVVTAFPVSYTAAELVLNISVANDGGADTASPARVSIALAFEGTQEATGQVTFPSVAAGSVAYQGLTLPVNAPPLWDPEHPFLHNLTLTLTWGGASETVVKRVGFRDVKLAGNRVVINGRPIKARGTTRHETHPLVGRSLWSLEPAGKQWERDISTFRDANVNYIRTSHYPPAEELMAAADELGMLIELEHPFCWATENAGAAAFNYTVQAQREAIVFNRNHPSVILWSLGNESPWLANFNASLAQYLRELDSTRPFMFDGGSQQPIPPLNVLSVHYPTFDGPGEYANGTQPTLFGEYAHLNCYNRREIATDQGVRDIWGLGIEKMWELVYASPGVLGACFWAGIDDIFFMPGGKPVGYGEWGVIDAWRRQKPETFLVRNIYSPVKLQIPEPGSAWVPHLSVSNRHDFSDLSEVAFAWLHLESGQTGQGSAAGGPHTDNLVLTLQGLPADLTGTLQVNASSPRGFLINAWTFPLQAPPARAPIPPSTGVAPGVQELPDGRLLIEDAAGTFAWFVSLNGSVAGNTSAGGALLNSGPQLMVLAINDEGGMQLTEDMPPILPYNDPLDGWVLTNRTFSVVDASVVVLLTGSYAEAAGTFALAFDGAARLTATYNFTWTQAAAVTPRQMGLVFSAPSDLATLSWRRTTPWTTYPPDHIGRPAGDGVTANAGPAPGNITRTAPWCDDPSPLGSPDFRSTRHNVSVFQLGAGPKALAFVSNGTQHGRAWIAASGDVGLLTADLSNEGGNPFSREKVLPNPKIQRGAIIQGQVVLQMGSALGRGSITP